MKTDILFLAHGRRHFTHASFETLLRNTPRELIGTINVFSDGAAIEAFYENIEHDIVIHHGAFGGPVAIMNEFLKCPGTPVFAKLDNDVIVPPGWLEACTGVMERHPELDLLGIEPPLSRTPSKQYGRVAPVPEVTGPFHRAAGAPYGYADTASIGGIGLMRRATWERIPATPMVPSGFRGVGGFTSWQLNHPGIIKGWIVDPLRVFLLDRMPIAPWQMLSDHYIETGLQRPWTRYSPAAAELWDWWTHEGMTARVVRSCEHEPDSDVCRVHLACGHSVVMVVNAILPVLPCGECVNNFVALKRELLAYWPD